METLDSLRRQYRPKILEITGRYGAENVRVFGSFVRGDQRADSDLDLLVELRPRTTLLQLAAMHRELAALLNREVDVVSQNGLSKYLRDSILYEAVPL